MKEKRLRKQIKKFVSEFLALALVMGMWQTPVFAGTGAGSGIATPGETTAGEATPGEATPGETTPGEATPGETTPGEATPGEAVTGIPDGYEEILLSAMNVNVTYPGGYQYIGNVTTKGANEEYKYLQFTYTGDISALRLEFGNGFFWMNKDQATHFVTKDGSDIPLTAATPTTVTIDLEKSGVKLSDFHMHNGDDALATGSKVTITEAKLLKPVVYEEVLLSAMNVNVTYPGGYQYIGNVTTKGANEEYKYLQFTYTGDISALRLEFGNGFFWMNKDQATHFVTKDGSDIPLTAATPTTVTIDLEKSGVALSDFHMHNGDDALATGSKVTITDAKLLKPVAYEEILLSAMNVNVTYPGGYQYIGNVTTKGAPADCKYLQFTYTGDISALRLEFGNGFFWMNKDQATHFVTKDGSDIPLTATTPTTVTIDLEKSGVALSDFHMHNGDDALATGSKIVITDAKLIRLKNVVESAAEPVITSNPMSNTYGLNAAATKLSVSANSTDGGVLSYQWYSNSEASSIGATAIEGATQASYTPATSAVGVTYYYCVVTNTNDKATVNKTATAESTFAKIEVTQEAGNNYGGLTDEIEAEIILDGDDKGDSSMIGDYGVVTASYKYLGYATTKDATSAYKYLLLTYTGDISYLRLEFNTADDSNAGPYWFAQDQDVKFTPAVSEGYTLVSNGDEPATVVVDLEKSGINLSEFVGIHMHYGDAALAANETALKIIDARLLKPAGAKEPEVPPVVVVKTAAKPSITANPASASYVYNKAATALTVAAKSADEGTLSYQWYSNTKDSIVGGTLIANATKASYTPATNKVGTTYYFCKVTNTNSKATEIKTATAYSKTAKVEVTKAANKITGVSSSYTKGIKSKAFTLKAKGQGKITYKSSNKKIVTVSSAGKVTIKGYGKATITITAAGNSNYTKVTKKVTVTVAPTTSLSKVQGQKRALKVTWKKDSKATGYQIQYSTDKKFKKSVKTVTIKKASTTSYTIKKLTGNKRYYVRMRAYKKVGKTTVYSSWTSAKNAKTKK